MKYGKLVAGLSLGAVAALGGLAAAPADEAENGCAGINEAQDRVGEDSPAYEVLEFVEELISDDGCDEHGNASDNKGDNGKRP
jgi:hypothetical protein